MLGNCALDRYACIGTVLYNLPPPLAPLCGIAAAGAFISAWRSGSKAREAAASLKSISGELDNVDVVFDMLELFDRDPEAFFKTELMSTPHMRGEIIVFATADVGLERSSPVCNGLER